VDGVNIRSDIDLVDAWTQDPYNNRPVDKIATQISTARTSHGITSQERDLVEKSLSRLADIIIFTFFDPKDKDRYGMDDPDWASWGVTTSKLDASDGKTWRVFVRVNVTQLRELLRCDETTPDGLAEKRNWRLAMATTVGQQKMQNDDLKSNSRLPWIIFWRRVKLFGTDFWTLVRWHSLFTR
jgi:hypothetical protein